MKMKREVKDLLEDGEFGDFPFGTLAFFNFSSTEGGDTEILFDTVPLSSSLLSRALSDFSISFVFLNESLSFKTAFFLMGLDNFTTIFWVSSSDSPLLLNWCLNFLLLDLSLKLGIKYAILSYKLFLRVLGVFITVNESSPLSYRLLNG